MLHRIASLFCLAFAIPHDMAIPRFVAPVFDPDQICRSHPHHPQPICGEAGINPARRQSPRRKPKTGATEKRDERSRP
jgi:hypothetical protein